MVDMEALKERFTKPSKGLSYAGNSLDVSAYLARYNIPVKDIKSHGTSTLYVLEHCIIDPNHKDGEAAIVQTSDGKLSYQCFHDSCKDRIWREARQIISGDAPLTDFMSGEHQPKPGNPDSASGNHAFRFVAAKELCAMPVPAFWLIKSIFDLNTLVCLFGESGSMKSFCAIDMGLSVALEIIWHGYSVKRSGTVFYICGEGKSGIGRRIKAFLQHHGIDPVVNVPFFVSERPARFLDDPREVTKAISELIKDHGTPVLVIVDTLNRNFGAGDENQTPDMTKFVNAMDDIRIEFGCTVLIVHHSGLADTTRGRGNSALKASVDWEYRMDKHSSGLRTLRCTKSKDHAQPEPINFIPKEVILDGWFDEDGQVMTSLVLVKTDTTTAQDKKRLTGFNKNGFDALISAMGNGASAHVDAWREAAYSAGITASSEPEAKKKAFQRLTRHLLINDYVETKDDYWWPKVDISPGHTGQDRDMSLSVPTPYRDGTGQGYLYPVPCPDVPSRSEVLDSGVRV